MKKKEFGLAIGDTYYRIFGIKENSRSVYFIPSFFKNGLHISLHRPNSDHPNFHAHIKASEPNIHVDLMDVDEKVLKERYKAFDTRHHRDVSERSSP